jgi:hypothetical protein
MDGFDFAAIFLVFATALAMTANNPREGRKLRALHHFGGFRASREPRFRALKHDPEKWEPVFRKDHAQIKR